MEKKNKPKGKKWTRADLNQEYIESKLNRVKFNRNEMRWSEIRILNEKEEELTNTPNDCWTDCCQLLSELSLFSRVTHPQLER